MFKQFPTSRKNALSGNLILLAASASIIGSRWGSYITIPGTSIYLIDFCFFLGIFMSLRCFSQIFPIEKALIFLTFFFILFQLTLNPETSLILKMRDLAPYLYLFFCTYCSNCNRKFRSKKNYLLHKICHSLAFYLGRFDCHTYTASNRNIIYLTNTHFLPTMGPDWNRNRNWTCFLVNISENED